MDIEDNGVRETDATYRAEIDKEIKKLLNKYRPIYFELKGTTNERINQMMNIIQF